MTDVSDDKIKEAFPKCLIEGTGKPLILIHGLGSSAHSWDELRPRLSDAYRVIAVTLPGHLDNLNPSPKGLADLTQFIKAGIEKSRLERPHLAGVSLGGAVALDVLRAAPALVSNVCAIGPGLAGPKANIQTAAAIIRGLVVTLKALNTWPIPQDLQDHLLLPIFRRKLESPMAAAFKDAVRACTAIDELADPAPGFAHGALPVEGRATLLWGMNDLLFPMQDVAHVAVKNLGGLSFAKLRPIPSSGHSTHVDQPDITALEIREACS